MPPQRIAEEFGQLACVRIDRSVVAKLRGVHRSGELNVADGSFADIGLSRE
jgi:hypothetical protein